MRVIFKDTRFKMSFGCYCNQLELKTLSDDDITKIAETAGENVEKSLEVALLKYRSELNKEEDK